MIPGVRYQTLPEAGLGSEPIIFIPSAQLVVTLDDVRKGSPPDSYMAQAAIGDYKNNCLQMNLPVDPSKIEEIRKTKNCLAFEPAKFPAAIVTQLTLLNEERARYVSELAEQHLKNTALLQEKTEEIQQQALKLLLESLLP